MNNNQQTLNDTLSRNERRRKKTKEIIRRAAIETFLKLGFINSTVQDITNCADLGYGTFYKYYKSKQDVIIELATEARDMIKNDYRRPPSTETSLYKRTFSKIEISFRTYFKHRDVIKILLDCNTTDNEINRVWNEIIGETFNGVTKDLTWSKKRGLCKDVDLNTAIIALHGMIQTIGINIVQSNVANQEIDKITHDVCSLFVDAIFVVEDIPAEFLIKTAK